MHLSRFSDSFVADRMADSMDDGHWSVLNPPRTAGADHRDGVVRGLMFICVVAVLITLVTASGLCRYPDTDPSDTSNQQVSTLTKMSRAIRAPS